MPGYVVLTCKYHKEGQEWVALCDELGTATFGATLDEAQARLEEAIELHLDTLEDVGERERFFRENNITYYRAKPRGEISVQVAPGKGEFVKPCIYPVRELTPA